MASPPRNRFRKKSASGSRIAALVIVVLIAGAVIGYFLRSPARKEHVAPQKPDVSRTAPEIPAAVVQKAPPSAPPVVPSPPAKDQADYPPPPAVPDAGKPDIGERVSARVAIVIDDMGSSLSEARALAAIKVPLTFAIIPGLHSDKDVAAFAAAHKIETMIHIPMQSKGWPERRLEANGLLVAMDSDELQERVAGFVRQFPGAVGVNNHMGSEFTEHEEKMTVVLQALKQHNLFFIDSVTSSQSAGLKVAQRLGIRAARRNVFLDNEQERGYILGQLGQAVRLARKNGSAIAICHPHPATIAALAAALPGLSAQGIRLVPASQLVR